MTHEELKELFRKELQSCYTKKKYSAQFNLEDEEQAMRVFELVLENPSLSENLIFELLTGEKG